MKVVLYMTMSVNGVIARYNDETPWSEAVWKLYSQRVKKCGNIIVGRRTYEIMKRAEEFQKIGNPYSVVVSSKKIRDKGVLGAKSPSEALMILKHRGFKTALVAGGDKLGSAFLEQGLVDEIILDVEPVLIGRGMRFFNSKYDLKVSLAGANRLKTNIVQLRYKVLR